VQSGGLGYDADVRAGVAVCELGGGVRGGLAVHDAARSSAAAENATHLIRPSRARAVQPLPVRW
jgi:hypothetical protein